MRVEKIVLRPGSAVKPDSVILELSNPQLEQELMDAQLKLQAAEAGLANLRVQLQNDLLTTRAAAANIEADYNKAKMQAQMNEALAKDQLVSDLVLKQSLVDADSLGARNQIAKDQLATKADSTRAQLAVQQSVVDQAHAVLQLKKQQKDELKVRAGIAGTLQLVPVEVGQQVAPGTNLCRVANPNRLKAEIKIAETQAKDIQIGQKAEVDTRNGIVQGKVSRIDPSVHQRHTVTVDVSLPDELPKGARPRSERRRHDRARTAQRRRLHGPSGVRPGSERGRPVQDLARWQRRGARPGEARRELGQHGRSTFGPEGRRSGDPVRHVGLRRIRPHQIEVARVQAEGLRGEDMSNGLQPLIKLDGVTKVFFTDEVETHALAGIHLEIGKGEYVSIAGPSGCGKSTLLSILGLLDSPTEGQYLLNSRPVAELPASERARVRNREIGFIFQSFNLIGDLTVFENVELPLTYRGMPAAERKQRAEAALERVGMAHRAKHLPSQLSGGQQQRVAVARAVAGEPLILLADEPTGNLDSRSGEAVMDLLRELHRAGATICMVTHDPRYARHADRSIHLFDGRVVEERMEMAVTE